MYISWYAEQETESSEHLSPREEMNKKTCSCLCFLLNFVSDSLLPPPPRWWPPVWSLLYSIRVENESFRAEKGGGEPPADLYFECGFATPLLGVSNPELQSSYVFSDVLTWKCLLNLSLWRHFNDGIMWQNLFFFVLMDMFAACNNHSLIFKNVFFCKPGFQIELVRCPYLELEVHWGIFLDFWIRNIKWNIDYFEKVKTKSVTDLLSLLLFECCWIFWHAFQYIWC